MGLTDKILLAERQGPWKDDITTAVAEIRPGIVEHTESAADLLRALTEDIQPRVIVVGHELSDGDSLDTIYQAKLENDKQKQTKKQRPILCLVTETRSDLELLDLLRQRGVAHFIYRDDLPTITVQRLLDIFDRPIQPAAYAVKIPTQVTIDEHTFPGTMVEIRLDGCEIIVHAKDLDLPSIGEWANLEFNATQANVVKCVGELRKVTEKRSWMKRSLHLELSFMAADFDARKNIEVLMHSLQLANSDDVTQRISVDQ